MTPSPEQVADLIAQLDPERRQQVFRYASQLRDSGVPVTCPKCNGLAQVREDGLLVIHVDAQQQSCGGSHTKAP
jgi:hypothetical protein